VGDAPRVRQTLPAAAGPPARCRASQVNVNAVLAVVAVAVFMVVLDRNGTPFHVDKL
jgi:hypothetical protein